MSEEPFKKAPAPWRTKAQVYNIPLYIPSAQTKDVPDLVFSPLEAASFFGSPQAGRPTGGLASIMILRYTDTPVGAYDELAILPSQFTYPVEQNGRRKEKKALRVTRIYVSNKDTNWNGRYNWSIPKHLARFDWTELPGGATNVKVFPHDIDGDPLESRPSKTPFFQATFKTVPYIPAFPASAALYKLVGIQPRIVQPPLPQGSSEELVGTDLWALSDLRQYSSSAHVGWFDLSQGGDQAEGAGQKQDANKGFWPGSGRWSLGLRMDDAVFEIADPQRWETPKSTL